MHSNFEEQTQTPGNPVCGGDMRKIIQCLIDWLDDNPSEAKAHRILRALANESLKKADYEEDKRRFDSMDIAAAANESKKSNTAANDWIDWKRTVLKYWETRENQIIAAARKLDLKFYPKPHRISTEGGPDVTIYLIKAEPLPEIIDETAPKQLQDQSDKITGQQTTVYYKIAENGEVKPAWIAKWLLHDGQIRLSIRLLVAYFSLLLILYLCLVALSLLSWTALSVPRPITIRDLTTLIAIFGVPYIAWLVFIQPCVRFFDDLIVPAPELLFSFKEKSAQLELFKDGDLRLIRLVRYTAPCPICGATIHLDDGSPDYPRRLVGRCCDSPREHVFSFDRVTQKGSALRSPL